MRIARDDLHEPKPVNVYLQEVMGLLGYTYSKFASLLNVDNAAIQRYTEGKKIHSEDSDEKRVFNNPAFHVLLKICDEVFDYEGEKVRINFYYLAYGQEPKLIGEGTKFVDEAASQAATMKKVGEALVEFGGKLSKIEAG